MRAAASSCVVHASDVPGLLTSGSAKHCVVAAQPMFTNAPLTHIAKPPSMHAWSPSLQLASALSVANCAFSFCASSAFWSWKSDEDDDAVEVEVEEAAPEVVVAAASVLVAAAAAVLVAASVLVAAASVDVDAAEVSELPEFDEPELLGIFWRPGS